MKQFALTLSLAVAALFVLPSTTSAKGKPGGNHQHRQERARHKSPEARLQFLTEKLGLDSNQQSQIKAIIEKNQPKIKELVAKGRGNLTDSDKAALRDLKKSQAGEVHAVLTPTQQEKIKELRREGHRGKRSAAPKPATE